MKKFGFPILILIFLVICLIFFICWADWVNQSQDRYGRSSNTAQVVLAVAAGILLLIHMITWPCVYGSTVGEIARMKAFCEATRKAYEYAVKATQQIEIKAIKEVSSQRVSKAPDFNQLVNLGDLAYLKLGEMTSQRVEELRDEVKRYNDKLETYRRWNEIFIARGFIANVPEKLELIIL